MPTIYHYCSTETFISIITNKTIRMSLLTLTNDSHEGRSIYNKILEFSYKTIANYHTRIQFKNTLDNIYNSFEGFGFCLSEESDPLSQWRGYADDGRGFCIGFDLEKLKTIGKQIDTDGKELFSVIKINYDTTLQNNVASEHFKKIEDYIGRGAFACHDQTSHTREEIENINTLTSLAQLDIILSIRNMFEFKNPSFIEEKEWRILKHKNTEPHFLKQTKFRSGIDKIIPYYDITIPENSHNAISELIIGPKHKTPLQVIEKFLSSQGLNNIRLTKSSSTYQ